MKRRIPTVRQKRILEYIGSFVAERGYPPSIREIGAACGLSSPRSVSRHLEILEAMGYIRRDRDKSRALELIRGSTSHGFEDSRDDPLTVPVMGRVRAGSPDAAVEDREGTVLLDPLLFGRGEFFLLRVEGESMIEAHILPGDLVVVRRASDAENGDIVVALLGEEATVKILEKRGERMRLVPANSEMRPIELGREGEEAAILGEVVGVVRRVGSRRP